MQRIRKSALAEADLAEIWLHIALDNLDAADGLLDRIEAQIQMLAGNPEAGRLRPEISAGLRSFPVGRHLLFYRPVPEGIELVRIIHGARDLPFVFSGVSESPADYRVAA